MGSVEVFSPPRKERFGVPVGPFSASIGTAIEEMEFILAAHFLRETSGCQKKACFGGFSGWYEAVRGSIFKAADCLASPAQSWYIRGVKQVVSGKLLSPLGTVSTLKKWEEPVHD